MYNDFDFSLDEPIEKNGKNEDLEKNLCSEETFIDNEPAKVKTTKVKDCSSNGCEGKPGVDCDYWNCSYCNYWNDGKTDNNVQVENETESRKFESNVVKNTCERSKSHKLDTSKKNEVDASKSEDIRDVYLKEMEQFLGEELGDENLNKSIQEEEDQSKIKDKTDFGNEKREEKVLHNDSLIKYKEPMNITCVDSLVVESPGNEIQKHIESSEPTAKENEDIIHNENDQLIPRLEKAFDGSTVSYETFSYTNEDVIKLDAKLHQFIEHLKTADPKVESSMAALGEAKEDVKKSHGIESNIRKELNDDFVCHLRSSKMKYDKDANPNDLNIDYSELEDQDESKLSLVEKLSMLEKIQNSILEEHDAFTGGDAANEDKVEQWLKDQSPSNSKEKKPFVGMSPRPHGQTPWEVVENDTICDLSETFTPVVSIKK